MAGLSILRGSGAESRRQAEAKLGADLVTEHWDLLYRSAYFICGDRWIAEDIAQDAALKALAALPSFDRGRPIEPWLSLIAANAAKDWLRLRARRPEVGLEEVGFEAPDPADFAESLAQRAIPDELAAELLKLDLTLRTVIVLRHLLDLTTAEIADLLEIEQTTVRTRLHRGLTRMRSALDKEGIDA